MSAKALRAIVVPSGPERPKRPFAKRGVRLEVKGLGPAGISLGNQRVWLAVGERFRLSEQELNVARQILTGHKVGLIADDLGLGLGTVKTYCQRLYHKLDVADRCSLAVMLLCAYFHHAQATHPNGRSLRKPPVRTPGSAAGARALDSTTHRVHRTASGSLLSARTAS